MKTNYLLALCAAPALVLTVSAEEESKLEVFGELMGATVEVADQYLDILNALKEGKTTPAEAAPLVDKLADTLGKLTAAMKQLAGSMTPEEQAELGKQLADPEVAKPLEEMSKAMEMVKAHLIEINYFDSAELKAACEKLDKAGE